MRALWRALLRVASLSLSATPLQPSGLEGYAPWVRFALWSSYRLNFLFSLRMPPIQRL